MKAKALPLRPSDALRVKLVGEVEVYVSYFGAKRQRGYHSKLKRRTGTLKQPVFGVFERYSRVLTEIVLDCKKADITGCHSRKSVITRRGL